MRTLVRISNALTNKALGNVDAGACIAERGCCCNAARTYGLNCYANCVRMSCSTRTSAYGQPCSGG
ncbi:MAG TPA: hypothetical protein VF557_19395 [Jatrophihabitans sp.]|jgi:hypothetical protein|uniref:hypothetical protein n=1 Tax=Jatrophihabitans sp. TaxID=1932789 RepID=UPI002F02DFA7